MKNQLFPITRSANEPDYFEPALVHHGHQYRQLVQAPTLGGTQGGYHTKNDHQGFSWRHDLDGKVREQNGRPIIELDDGSLFLIGTPSGFLAGIWTDLTVSRP
jgi:hypothetical protein